MTALLVCALLTAVVAGARGTWSPCGLSMVAAINPLAETARGHRYALTCAWFVAGALAGGAALGAGSAALAAVVELLAAPEGVVGGLAALAALVCLASDLGVGPTLPLHPRQVDETWLGRYRRWVYASGFGAQIGAGLATYVMTSATYLVVVLAALTGSPAQAVLVGVVFGFVRGLAVLLTATTRTPEDLFALHRRLERADPWSLRLAEVVQAGAAVALGTVAAGPTGAGAAAVAALTLGVVAHRTGAVPGASCPVPSTGDVPAGVVTRRPATGVPTG